MKKFILAILAAAGVTAVAAPASAQGFWFGGPGFGVGIGAGADYSPYYASDWGGPNWGPSWSSGYGYGPGFGYRSYGYPVSYGYPSDWYESDVALETYPVPSVRTYAVASESYGYPRSFGYRPERSYAYAPSRSRYTRAVNRSYGYAPSRVGFTTDRTSSLARTAVRHRGSLHAMDRTRIRGTTEFGNSRSMRSAPVGMSRGSVNVRAGSPSQVRHRQMDGPMR